MAHFAKVEDGIVTSVIVAEQDHINTLEGTWVQTSYNTRGGVHYAPNSWEPDNGTPLRKNFATLGGIYDSVRDAFYEQKPFASWSLNETSCLWEPPIAKPEGSYQWNEDAYQADNTQGWVEQPSEE